MTWTSDNDGPFVSQEYVDQFFEDTQGLANSVNSEEDAVAVLKRIKYLDYVSDNFYVPNETGAWEEMCLSYIESPRALFQNVHYDLILEEHKKFFEAARELEQAVLKGSLADEILFELVCQFNIDTDEANINCEKYNMMKFVKYWFESKDLEKRYEKWLKA